MVGVTDSRFRLVAVLGDLAGSILNPPMRISTKWARLLKESRPGKLTWRAISPWEWRINHTLTRSTSNGYILAPNVKFVEFRTDLE